MGHRLLHQVGLRMAASRPLLAASLLALLVLAVPLAAADHVFSHRTYIVGRVVDVDGKPAAGMPVGVAFTNLTAGGRCFDSRVEATGPQGDFVVCRHTHVLPQNATVTVTVGNASVTVPVDPDLRSAVAHVQLAEPAPARDIAGDRLFERTYRVAGRAYVLLTEPTQVEGVTVNATPLLGVNVTVRLEAGGQTLAEDVTTVDDMGAFDVDLAVDGPVPPGAVVRVLAGGVEVDAKASPVHRRSDVDVLREPRREVPLDEVPGSSPTPVPALVPLAALGAAVAARFAYGRRTR